MLHLCRRYISEQEDYECEKDGTFRQEKKILGKARRNCHILGAWFDFGVGAG